MICRGLCACTDVLWMCVLYVSCVILQGYGVNRVQVVLSRY